MINEDVPDVIQGESESLVVMPEEYSIGDISCKSPTLPPPCVSSLTGELQIRIEDVVEGIGIVGLLLIK